MEEDAFTFQLPTIVSIPVDVAPMRGCGRWSGCKLRGRTSRRFLAGARRLFDGLDDTLHGRTIDAVKREIPKNDRSSCDLPPLTPPRGHRFLAILVVALCLPGLAAGAGDTWYQASSSHFTVVSDGGEQRARMVAEELELFRRAFEAVLRVRVESGKPFVVMAANSEGSLRRLIPWSWERRGGARPEGVYFAGEDEDWAVLRTDVANPTSVIVHEYVHSLARLNLSGLPLWFDEGLAQLYGASRVEPDGIRVGGLLSAWQVTALRNAKLLPVADLMTVGRGSPDYTDRKRAGVFYAESLLLTHFLLLGDDGSHRAGLDRFLELLDEGASDHEALVRAFGGPETLDKGLRAYLDQGQFPYAKLTARASDLPISVRKLRPAEAAARLAEFMLRTGQRQTASEMAYEALRSEPGLGSAHLVQGLLLFNQCHLAEATAALAEAQKLSPDDAMVQYRFGTLGRGAVADSCSREEALRTAIRLTPSFAAPHDALAKLFIEEGCPPGEALAEAREAVRLEPGSARYRITLLDLETQAGHSEAARGVEDELWRAVRSSPSALVALTSHYEAKWAPGKAEYLLRQVLDRNPHDVVAVGRLASLVKEEGWPEESEAILRSGLVASPHSAYLLNELAYLNANRDTKLAEALAFADEALTLEPSNPNVQDTKAWALFQLGRYREAEELARQSLETFDSPTVREHLGDILNREGRVESALAEWRKVLACDAISDESRKELKAKIDRTEATPPKAQ